MAKAKDLEARTAAVLSREDMMQALTIYGTALAFLVVVATSCGGPASDLPTPPPSPRASAPPPPPGAGDIASQRFASPLSAADAEQILARTEIFAWGDANRWIQAYNVLLDQPDALARFRSLVSRARWAGQLYALCALFALEPATAQQEAKRLEEVHDEILVFESDVVTNQPVARLVGLVRERRLWIEFRRLRREANRRFDKAA